MSYSDVAYLLQDLSPNVTGEEISITAYGTANIVSQAKDKELAGALRVASPTNLRQTAVFFTYVELIFQMHFITLKRVPSKTFEVCCRKFLLHTMRKLAATTITYKIDG